VRRVFWAVEGVPDRIYGHHQQAVDAMRFSSVLCPVLMHSTDMAKLEAFARGQLVDD
jgi:hypothetical protein